MAWGITILVGGYFVCCVILNIYWHREFQEYNVLWAGFGAFFWPILLLFGVLGLIGMLIAKPIEKIIGED